MKTTLKGLKELELCGYGFFGGHKPCFARCSSIARITSALSVLLDFLMYPWKASRRSIGIQTCNGAPTLGILLCTFFFARDCFLVAILDWTRMATHLFNVLYVNRLRHGAYYFWRKFTFGVDNWTPICL